MVALFDGPPDQPTAKLVIREVKGHIDGYVPIEEFSAIRPPGLEKNLEVLENMCDASLEARREGLPDNTSLSDLSKPQVEAIRSAIASNAVEIQVVLGPHARLGTEARSNSVLSKLRAEIDSALKPGVFAGPAGGYTPERIDSSRVESHTGAAR